MHDARDRNAGIWIEPSDRLYCAAYSSVASLTVRFSGYFRRANGEMTEFAVDIRPTADRAVTASDVFFGGGFLLSCVAHLASGNANRGQCYVRAQVQRGTGTVAVKLHTVVAGYVTDDYAPSFPYGTQEGSLEGAGYLGEEQPSDPAAGIMLSYPTPTGCRRRLRQISIEVLADANVANRTLALQLTGANGVLASSPWGPAQAAGADRTYRFGEYGFTETAFVNSVVHLGIAPWWLHTLTSIDTELGNVQVGDLIRNIYIQYEEWLEA